MHTSVVFGTSMLLAIAATVRAQEASTSLSWENIFSLNRAVQSVDISPDDRYAAATVSGNEGSAIYLVALPNGNHTSRWVGGRDPSWLAESDKIVFSRDNDLWTVARNSQTPERITQDGIAKRAARPSPDGKWVAFFSGRSGTQDIWVVASHGVGTARQLTHHAYALDDQRFAPAWSPDGRKIAYISNHAGDLNDDVWVVDVATSEERQLSRGVMAMSTPVWSPDGSRIAILGNAESGLWYEDLTDLYVIDARTGATRKVSMEVFATDDEFQLGVLWSPDGKDLFFSFLERGKNELWRVPASGGLATQATNFGGLFTAFAQTHRGDGFVFVRSTPTRGKELDYFDAAGGEPRQITHLATRWAGLAEPTQVSYRSWDGVYIAGYEFLPPKFDRSKKYPCLVLVHGGGTNSFTDDEQDDALIAQKLAQDGYVVFAINYRGGSGYGRLFEDAAVNDWGGGQARDAAAAARFLRSQPWSSQEVGIYGYSYGGIMTMAAISQVPDAFDAAVAMAGIYDFAAAYRNGDRLGRIFFRMGHGGSPEERPESYASSRTLSRIERIKTPVLIMHGEADVRAPFQQFELAVAALRKSGKTFESHSYPGEPHDFTKPQDYVDLYSRLEDWFDRHLH